METEEEIKMKKCPFCGIIFAELVCPNCGVLIT